MGIAENTQDRLVLQSGGATLSFDKQAKKAELQRKGFLWKPKPLSEPLGSVAEIAVDSGVDRASGVEICNTMVIFRDGAAWAFGANDKAEAQANAEAVRKFLGMH
jgi:hypothetical protein